MRSHVEVYVDVLLVIKEGEQKPTRIMYRTNLSWGPLMKILDAMGKQGLITVERQKKHVSYKITEKGINVLNYFHEALELLAPYALVS
jgi:predicted transcriptional regulator